MPSVVVPAARSRVFAYLADPRHRPAWQASLRRVEMLDDGPPRVGMRWVDHLWGGPSFRLAITELVPDARWAETGTVGPFTVSVALLFSDAGPGATRVGVEVGAHASGVLAPLARLVAVALSLLVRLDLPRLSRAAGARG